MAFVALTSLMATIELEFLQPKPRVRVSPYDRPLIISFLANLYGLQVEIQKDSSSDGIVVRDLEIEIRNFALKAEDDIEIQLSSILLGEDTEYRERASHELIHQTLREAEQNAAELLKTITRQKESSCPSDTEMDLTVLITKFDAFLFASLIITAEETRGTTTTAAIQNLENQITDFSLKAECHIEMQLSSILVAEDRERAFHELIHQTLREAEQNAAELLKRIIRESGLEESSSCVSGGKMVVPIVALTILITKIKYSFLKPLSNLSLPHPPSIKSFFANLSSLQAFLQKESSASGALKDLEIQIRDFALQAKDYIDIPLTKFLLAKNTWHRKEVSKELLRTLRKAAKNAAELLEIINSTSNETQPWIHWSKRDSEFENAKELVGRDTEFENAKELVGRDNYRLLIRNQLELKEWEWIFSRGLRLISIVGMPGIGKTALATSVYIDNDIKKSFDVRCWISMPKTYSETQMLRSLLWSITPAEPNDVKKGSTPDELAGQVCKRLKDKRFLIVLDNFWNNEAWDDIKRCFPNDKNGSRISLTTTHFRDSYGSSSDYILKMTLLDPDKSWDLFCSTLSIKGDMAAKFEVIRRDVVEKCDGLPQLIIAVAKRLSKCNNIQEKWKKIEKELESLGILDRNVLIPSYNRLPHHLKVCFLYLGAFPKRYQILAKMLIRLWISEGFVKPLEHKELETQAFGYLQELIDRSLLLIGNQSFDGKMKTCRLHSAFHSLCVVEAQKEGILCALNTQKHLGLPLKMFTNSCRWLSFYSHSFDYYVHFETNIPRSIFIFHENPEMFIRLKLLRVLAFDISIFLQRVPLHLGDLVYLRYLSITQRFEGMDEVVSNNPNLQTLVVTNNGTPTFHLSSSIWEALCLRHLELGAPTFHLSFSIWEAPCLRHLELGSLYSVDPPSMIKENLQSLSWVVRPIHFRGEVYDKFPNIKKLKIFLEDDIEAKKICGSYSNPIVLDDLGHLEKLEKLNISVSGGYAVTLTERFRFPSQLKKLRLSGTNLSERDLTIIGMLSQLVVLKLENAFNGAVWELSNHGQFRSLRLLLLEAKHLECLEAMSNHFPVLEHLILRCCNSLRYIPLEFAEIFTLRSIELEECSRSVIESAKQIQEELRDYGNENLELKILGPVHDESIEEYKYRCMISEEEDLA